MSSLYMILNSTTGNLWDIFVKGITSATATFNNLTITSGLTWSATNIALGNSASVGTGGCISIGASTTTTNGGVAVGDASVANNNDDTAGGVAVGYRANAGSSSESSVAVGSFTNGSAPGAIAIGSNANANQPNAVGSIAIGYSANSSCNDPTVSTIAIGANSVASYGGCVAIGDNASASGVTVPTIAIGVNSSVSAGIGIGNHAVASNGYVFGHNATDNGHTGIVIGGFASISADGNIGLSGVTVNSGSNSSTKYINVEIGGTTYKILLA